MPAYCHTKHFKRERLVVSAILDTCNSDKGEMKMNYLIFKEGDRMGRGFVFRTQVMAIGVHVSTKLNHCLLDKASFCIAFGFPFFLFVFGKSALPDPELGFPFYQDFPL